jgi:formylglycine-generating enzyme required for sulfatase activity
VFQDSRQWCFLALKPGGEPLKALVELFLDTWQFAATDPDRVKQQNGWIELLREGKATLPDLIDATERRRKELNQSKPPGFFLYVDQGEELYIRAEGSQRRRFSELLATALPDSRLRAMMSIRSDFLGSLQNDALLFEVRQQIDVPPLGEKQLRDVVSRPAQLLAARFETERLIDIITQRTAEDSVRDVGALPLLSYTLDDMWTEMARADDGILRLPAQSFELGGVLIDRANNFLATHSGAESAVRRILTLRCATVREDGEPTRRRAPRAEFSDEEWRLVGELADYPNRLLVTVTSETGEASAEVAHEAIFRRWDKLREWIASEREFLAWRSGLEAGEHLWQATPHASKDDALLMGFALAQAKSWLAKRPDDIPKADRDFIVHSRQAARRRQLTLAGSVAAVIVVGIAAWIEHDNLDALSRYVTVTRPYIVSQVRPYVLTAAKEQVLKPGNSFRECARDCPEMIVVPAGSFSMGAQASESGAPGYENEIPQHTVTMAAPFSVSKYQVTFADWDSCVSLGGCNGYKPSDQDWGRGQQPVIDLSWEDAKSYVSWLAKITGKPYRLLTEAEYEYATRSGTTSVYPWGNDIGNNANCAGCGSKWDNIQTAPVDSFSPNKFGLYNMLGNVWEWTEDCSHQSYNGAPSDRSAWLEAAGADCSNRIVRGGSRNSTPDNLRSANRVSVPARVRNNQLGFRVARTLVSP